MKITTKHFTQMTRFSYYAIFESSKGRKDLVFISRSLEYSRFVAGQFHSQKPYSNYTVYGLVDCEYNGTLTVLSVNGDLRKF